MVRPDRDEHPRATTAGIHGTPGGNFPEKERARVEVGHWQCSRSFSILRTDEALGRPIGAMGAFLAGYPGGYMHPAAVRRLVLGLQVGVGNGNRTRNRRSHSPVLCQLSYSHRHVDYTTALRPCQKLTFASRLQFPNR